jgi:radical SAM family RiPP maturation amino acid epimerase
MVESSGLSALDPVQVRRVCHVKRFLERWAADENFRAELQSDASVAARKYGLQADPEEIRPLWDHGSDERNGPIVNIDQGQKSTLVSDYYTVRETKRQISEQFRRDCSPINPFFRTWRDRQVERGRSEFTPRLFSAIQHPPFAIELGVGCSVGCWFCGVSAERLSSQLTYTAETARVWSETLEVVRSFAGKRAGSRCFLYWATDPLDNPDYELFGKDFKNVFGTFPHTTTAQVHKHLDRTRQLLNVTGPKDPFLLRFSVLSTSLLDRIHAYFSAEELEFVEIIPQTSGSIIEKVRVGRARTLQILNSPKMSQLASEDSGRTIACVSGFLLNMVSKEIKLVSPCTASDRWPNGYHVYGVSHFENPIHLESIINDMIARHMPATPFSDRALKFRDDLAFEETLSGFRLRNSHGEQMFDGNLFIRQLGQLIRHGKHTPTSLCAWFEAERGLPSALPEGWLLDLFRAGVLDEQPRQFQ